MKIIKGLLIASIFSTALVSCGDDDNGPVEPVVTAPATYAFDRDGSSTVSFGGQTTRIKMATELVSAMTSFDNLTEAKLDNMFANENNPFADASLNASSKTVKSKTAASADYFASNQAGRATIISYLEGLLATQAGEVKTNRNRNASNGNAGQLADGNRARYVNSKGLEPNQLFAKSLIGGLMVDQSLNNYLSTAVLDASTNRADNDAGTVASGKSYTTMEHKWDEAYGYVYGLSSNPATPNNDLGADNFLNKYIGKVNGDSDFNTIAATIFDAFKKGRAAIVAKNYTVRDEQADIIKENISKVVAVRAVHYLQAAKAAKAANNLGGAAHDLSEGVGFVYSLQFTQNPSTKQPYMSAAEVNTFLNEVNNTYTVSAATLDRWSNEIAGRFGFTTDQAAN